jgi:hypothetical protein
MNDHGATRKIARVAYWYGLDLHGLDKRQQRRRIRRVTRFWRAQPVMTVNKESYDRLVKEIYG